MQLQLQFHELYMHTDGLREGTATVPRSVVARCSYKGSGAFHTVLLKYLCITDSVLVFLPTCRVYRTAYGCFTFGFFFYPGAVVRDPIPFRIPEMTSSRRDGQIPYRTTTRQDRHRTRKIELTRQK